MNGIAQGSAGNGKDSQSGDENMDYISKIMQATNFTGNGGQPPKTLRVALADYNPARSGARFPETSRSLHIVRCMDGTASHGYYVESIQGDTVYLFPEPVTVAPDILVTHPGKK